MITRLPDDNGHRRLALAYPAEHTQLDLTLDETGRILHETLTAPNHLVTRTFVYPETGRRAMSTEHPGPIESAFTSTA